MPSEQWLSVVLPIYKNKSDAQSCVNYCGIKLLSHMMKLSERVNEWRLRRLIDISENQFIFMHGRSMTDTIYLVRCLMTKYRERFKDFYMMFIDLEKANDSVPRAVIWRYLKAKGVPGVYICIYT